MDYQTLQWNAPPAAKANAPARPSVVNLVRQQSGGADVFGPDDPQLQSAMMALSGPLYNGPLISQLHGRRANGTINARFDNAQYAEDMRKHWAMADYLGPDAAANQGVRYLLRIRSRYEVANNSYARGIVTTVANDTIGAGPQLHMTTDDQNVNRIVRDEFAKWCDEIDLSSKLRTMRMAKCQDGETFAVQVGRKVTQEHIARGGCPVELNVRIVEADQCATVAAMQFSVPSVDGIELDEYFQPKNYFILRVHPGNYAYLPGYVGFPWDYDTFPADKVCHWFRKERPELHRGIPEITPALNLFAQLRDFTNSILKSARIQSAWAISIQTNAPAGGEAANVAPMDVIDFEDGMAMTMPAGWEAKGFNPTNPPAAYATFKRELLCEIGRCINMPLCVIAGDSSGYNYASGRLDFQVYWKSISVDRSECELSVLEKIFRWWIEEAVLIERYLPQQVRNIKADLRHEWFWPGESHVDPTKESSATQQNLGSCTTNLRIEYAKQGRDWEAEVRQRGAEIKLCKELEITMPQAMAAPEQDDETGDANDEDKPEKAKARRRPEPLNSKQKFDETKHPRRDDGEFGEGGGGTATKTKPSKTSSTKSESDPHNDPESPVTLTKVSKRAFSGEPVPTKTQLSKSTTGKLAENIVIQYCKQIKGKKDARHLNLDRNNFPIDLVQDHESIEVKGGLISNGSDAQKWRLTIGEPGKKEKEWLTKASPAAKEKWNARKQEAIIERKAVCLKNLSKELGKPVKAKTMTVIINPDTKTADVFEFSGWHDRISWRSDQAKAAYVGTVKYG